MYILPMNSKYKVWKKWQRAFKWSNKMVKAETDSINKGIVSAFSSSNKLHEKNTLTNIICIISKSMHVFKMCKFKEEQNE